MKKYIKKFDSPSAADQYSISDIPFITTIASTKQNLHCNEEGKKLVNTSGVVSVETDGPEMVDLGLSSGTLWAKDNLGANPGNTADSYYGDSYAWGELITKETYTWDNYRFGGDYNGGQTKYNNTDHKIILDSEDDIVNVTYGGNYCIPTQDDIQELLDNTTKTFIASYDGISELWGYKFTNKNDSTKFIFIPFLQNSGYHNILWTSTVPYDACGSTIRGIAPDQYGGADISVSDSYRLEGLKIRPVQHIS